VNRADFQNLARIRVKEAKALLDRRLYDGAYYVAGYAVECALKACIAKKTKRYEFPKKELVNQSYTHNLSQLLRIAGLEKDQEQRAVQDEEFGRKWNLVKNWSEESRYESAGEAKARDLYLAIADRKNGVLQWLKNHW